MKLRNSLPPSPPHTPPMILISTMSVLQCGEGVGRRHPRSVPERRPLRPDAAGGGSPAHQELAVGHQSHAVSCFVLLLINPPNNSVSAHVWPVNAILLITAVKQHVLNSY